MYKDGMIWKLLVVVAAGLVIISRPQYFVVGDKKFFYWSWSGNSSALFLRFLRSASLVRASLTQTAPALSPFVSKYLQGRAAFVRFEGGYSKKFWNDVRWTVRWRRLHIVRRRKKTKKKLGRWFRRWVNFLEAEKFLEKKIYLPTEERPRLGSLLFAAPRRRRAQRRVNIEIHNFLFYRKRQFGILKRRPQFLSCFYLNTINNIEDSKKLWWLYKRYIRNRTWVYKKKFTVEQQYRYYKYNRFVPKLKLRRAYGLRARWFIRMLAGGNTALRLQARVNKLFGENQKLVGKMNSLVGRSIKLRRDFRLSYFCLVMQKKKNNYYLTLIDGTGNTKTFISLGAFLLKFGDKKRNKKLRGSFRYFMEVLRYFINKLKQRGVYRINYFFKPVGLKRKLLRLVLNTLIENRITVVHITKIKMPRHRLRKKLKKIRRL